MVGSLTANERSVHSTCGVRSRHKRPWNNSRRFDRFPLLLDLSVAIDSWPERTLCVKGGFPTRRRTTGDVADSFKGVHPVNSGHFKPDRRLLFPVHSYSIG